MAKTYKDLYTTNCDYNPILNKKLQLLYEGGFKILENAGLFLERLQGIETTKAYQSRLKAVSYLPYLSEFITQFSASLFSESLEVKTVADAADPTTAGNDMTDEFYKDFLNCCDLERRSYHQFAQDTLEKALSELCVYVCMDFPKGERINRAQERADGLDRGYICTIPYENVIDWKIDPATGKFIWLKEFEECMVNDDPMVEPKHYYMFRFRTLKPGKKGKSYGGCEVWKSEVMPITKKFTANTKFTQDANESSVTSFPEINVWRLAINRAYHVGQQIGSICQEHYQRRSFMVSNSNKTCVAMGTITLGPEVGAPGDNIPPDIEMPETSTDLRKKLENDGWIVLRQTDKWADKIDIVEAKGESHKFVADELKHLVEAMMQTLRQMNMTARANTSAVGRSAASKQVDQHGTSMLLSVYERVVKDFTKLLFTCLAAGREEDIRWAVEGLSIAEPTFDRTQAVTEVTQFGVDILKFPAMWKFKYLNRVATELIDNNLTDEERIELEKKFDESIKAGDFDAIDLEEATAAGNKLAKTALINKSKNSGGSGSTTDNGLTPSRTAQVNPPVNKDGIKELPPGSHTQTGQHIDPMVVYNQLLKDYKPKDIEWIKSAAIRGPVAVQHSDISYQNENNWKANKPGPQGVDKVEKFSKEMDDKGFSAFNPVLLASTPKDDEKYVPLDGRHRVKAAQKSNIPVVAYIVDVGSTDEDTPHMSLHGKQITDNNSEGGNNSSGG